MAASFRVDQKETLQFSDLTVGLYLHVVADKHQDGTWWATEIKVLPKRREGKPTTTPGTAP